jgi:hypothetical protein
LDKLPPDRPSSTTSIAAARSVAHAVGYIESRIINHLLECGPRGSTADEAEEFLDLRQATGSARFSEMAAAGKIIRTTSTRKTRSGRAAAVHVHPRHASTPSASTEAPGRAAPAAGNTGAAAAIAGPGGDPDQARPALPTISPPPIGGNSTPGVQGCQSRQPS